MASKNPVKGYVLCPTAECGEVCTVHAVGEHKALTEGETPKNPRRLGQLYTICPNCKTNQSAGKPFQTWLTENMKATKEEAKAVKGTGQTENKPVKPVTKPNQTSKHAASGKQPLTETEPDETEKSNLLGLGLSLLGFFSLCCLLFWLVSSLKKKPEAAPCKKAA